MYSVQAALLRIMYPFDICWSKTTHFGRISSKVREGEKKEIYYEGIMASSSVFQLIGRNVIIHENIVCGRSQIDSRKCKIFISQISMQIELKHVMGFGEKRISALKRDTVHGTTSL